MFYYIKIRKKGDLIWKTLRKDGKILVFNRYENAKKYSDNLKDCICEIISLNYHPSHKKGPIYRKKYQKAEW